MSSFNIVAFIFCASQFTAVIIAFKSNLLSIETEDAAKRFPYHVEIRSKHPNRTEKMCSGAILNNFLIVTTANCVEDVRPFEINVHVGLEKSNISSKPFEIRQIKIHEKYNNRSLCNNIAILQSHSNISSKIVYLPSVNYTIHNDRKLVSECGRENVSS